MKSMADWASPLFFVGCAPFVVLGGIHLVYTLATRKFYPRDEQLTAAMQAVSPRISTETTLWKAWTGFNISHSLGAIIFGLVFIALAIEYPRIMAESVTLNVLSIVFPLSMYLTARRYWFVIPRRGLALALICLTLAALLRLI